MLIELRRVLLRDNICHLFGRQFNCELKSVWYQSLRRSHWKFNSRIKLQQTTSLDKFINKNQNILDKLLDNKPKVVPKGSPNRREIDGTDRRLVTRRMTVLNKQFMSCISDVLSTELIGNKIRELEVRITQVEVNRRCDSVNVYWISTFEDTERVAQELDQMKGRLHHHMMERNIMHSVPWIQFVLDNNENHSQEVHKILRKCDFGSDFESSDSTLFETPYELIGKKEDKRKTKDNFECNQNIYEFLKIQKPNDMKMDCLGLDYESLINIILLNLNKCRAQHRSFNAVADPLPPPDWSAANPQPKTSNESEAVYNTDERIKAMKRFLVENRKKKERLSREKDKKAILQEMQITTHLTEAYDNYQLNEQQLEEELKYDFESHNDFNESNEEFDKF